jgi:thiosulfate reductase cytochrome b subunit
MRERIHPLLIRLTHWLNFIALAIMVSSGMRIYNASPIFGFRFPPVLTLGGWLAGARQWHFFAMWIFVVNGLIWWAYNAISKHGRETTLFQRSDIKGVLPMIKYYLRIEKKHPEIKKYNALQKLAYTSIPFIALAGILSGLEMYWPVQLQFLGKIFGGYDGARIWHFCAMSALVLFFLGHLVMVAIAGWSNFLSMITGTRKVESGKS